MPADECNSAADSTAGHQSQPRSGRSARRRSREFAVQGIYQWLVAATDSGLRKITARTGLFWPEAKQALESDDWRETEAENRQLMMSMGSWGVPTICMGDYTVWGQDRLWLLARHIEELCDSGDGILA